MCQVATGMDLNHKLKLSLNVLSQLLTSTMWLQVKYTYIIKNSSVHVVNSRILSSLITVISIGITRF